LESEVRFLSRSCPPSASYITRLFFNRKVYYKKFFLELIIQFSELSNI